MAPETLAEQVKSEGVDAGGGEAEDPGQQGDDQVGQRQVHLVVVEGTVHVENVVGEPAQGKETHEHQDNLGQTLPGLDLEERKESGIRVWSCARLFQTSSGGTIRC